MTSAATTRRSVTVRAPAKVNLFLHVGPVAPDGYHPIASWMVFADIGDTLRLEPADAWSLGSQPSCARAAAKCAVSTLDGRA